MVSCARNVCQLYITCLLHFFSSFPSTLFSFFTSPSYLFYFPFPHPLPHILLFPSLFQTSLPDSPFCIPHPPSHHVPSAWSLYLSSFSSNTTRAAFLPAASGVASLGALLMGPRARKPCKCQAEVTPHGAAPCVKPCTAPMPYNPIITLRGEQT